MGEIVAQLNVRSQNVSW